MAGAKKPAGALPPRVMAGVSWRFHGRPYASQARFDTEARRQQIDLAGRDRGWNPDEVVIRRSKIRVRYWGWDARRSQEETERTIVLASGRRARFTAGDLLRKLHNAVVKELSRIDHQFFEGLVLVRRTAGDPIPEYRLVQGS